MNLFQNAVVFDQFVPDTTAVYSSPETYALLGSADKLFVQLRASQSGGQNPTVTVALETCNDASASTWYAKATVIATSNIATGTVTYLYGTDAGSDPSGALVRLKITLGGTSPSAAIRLSVSGQVD